jgi:hypothetical protein
MIKFSNSFISLPHNRTLFFTVGWLLLIRSSITFKWKAYLNIEIMFLSRYWKFRRQLRRWEAGSSLVLHTFNKGSWLSRFENNFISRQIITEKICYEYTHTYIYIIASVILIISECFPLFFMPSEDLSSVIKLHPLADKLPLLFPFEWDNAIIRVLFGVTSSLGKLCLL